MTHDDAFFLSLRGVQLSLLAYAAYYLFAHGRETIPCAFEAVAALFVLDFFLILASLPDEISRSFNPGLVQWGWLFYDMMLPLIILRIMAVRAREIRRQLWSRHS